MIQDKALRYCRSKIGRSWVQIPLGLTFYMESENSKPKRLPYISGNSVIHP